MRDEAKVMRDETDRLQNSNKTLQERFTTLQLEATKLTKERNALQNELNELRRRGEGTSKSRHDSKDDDSNDIQALREELRIAKEDSSKRISDAPQFQQMRQLMQSQNNKIKALR